MISLKYRFLFIHIPKTAGNSIQNILRDYSEEHVVKILPHHDGVERFEIRSDSYTIKKHSTLLEYQNQLGAGKIDGLFKFTCVRNPWDRLISFYFSPHRFTNTWDKDDFISLMANVLPVTAFLSSSEGDRSGQKCFRNVDYYIRYEALNQDFESVCNRIGIPHVRLPRRNASMREHYSTYYDDELKEMVGDRFREEIKFFGYEFK